MTKRSLAPKWIGHRHVGQIMLIFKYIDKGLRFVSSISPLKIQLIEVFSWVKTDPQPQYAKKDLRIKKFTPPSIISKKINVKSSFTLSLRASINECI